MPTFQLNKLIRDKILDWFLSEGHEVTYQHLSELALKRALRDKLHEEADELPIQETVDTSVVEELADVRQIVDDLQALYGISDTELDEAKQAKYRKRGGFAAGVFVDSVELPEEDEWTAYYRASPDKYPELGGETDNEDPVLPSLQKGIYRHTKSGKLYDVIGVTFHTETLEPLVIYAPRYESTYEFFVRPYDMFVATIERDGATVPRFQYVQASEEDASTL